MTIAAIHACFLQSTGVVIDTRKLTPNSFFVALKGERFDANTFAQEALALGASYVLIDNATYFVDERTILVSDTLQCLQELARFHRQYLGIPIIALTGSNGKTTTKELLNAVLSQQYICTATVGNLNNHIGVPLTLLSFTTKTEIGIVEMGANHQQEIAFLCAMAEPDYGYITNFGKAHLEGFGGVEGVIKGKSELYDYVRAHQKAVFINADDAIQFEKSKGISQFSFSQTQALADVSLYGVEANPFVTVTCNSTPIHSQLIGIYNATNIAAAIAVGIYFKVDLSKIKQAIESYVPSNNRSQIIHKGTKKILLDAYNANPSSMAAAVANFAQLEDNSKMMILGDMFELGDESAFEHESLIDLVLQSGISSAYFVGPSFYAFKRSLPGIYFYQSYDDFELDIKNKSVQNSLILIKGSRGMALERIVPFL